MTSQGLNIDALSKDYASLLQSFIQGMEHLSRLQEEDIAVGTSEKELVYSQGNVSLYRYKSFGQTARIPLLLCYALVNRPSILDLSEDLSFVRGLLSSGIDVYLLDWGYAQREDRYSTLDDYVNGYLDACVGYILESHGLSKLSLLGVCQGGVLSLCYAALYPEKIHNLVTMVTPVDFHAPQSMLGSWAGSCLGSRAMDTQCMREAFGNIPGDLMNSGFLMLKPFELGFQKYFALLEQMHDKERLINFLRMEKWIFDSPDQAGEAWHEFISNLYQNNQLVKGQLRIGGLVNLKNIRVPCLNILAEKDHLVPPESTASLRTYISSSDYTLKTFPTGHIGLYVSKRIHKELVACVSQWLLDRMEYGGTQC